MTIIVAASTAANPAAPYTGWSKPAAARDVQVLLTGGIYLFRRSSGTAGQLAIWTDNVDYTGNTLVAKFTHGANATQGGNDSARLVFLNASGNGYALWLNQAGTEARVYKVIACVLDATQIATFTSYGTGYSQLFELRCVDKSTGTFQVWYSGSQIGSNVVDTTYTSLTKIGFGVNGGHVISMESGELYDVISITDPIVIGSGISVATEGYSTVTSVSGGGMSATGVSYSAGTTTATWPAISESISPTIALPATDVTITVTDGSNPRTIVADINLAAGWASVQFGTPINEPDYLLSGVPIVSGYYGYYETNQPGVGNVVIYPDGSVYTDAGGLLTMHLHKLGTGLPLEQYNITAPAGGVNPPQSGTKLSGKNITATKISASKLIGSKFR